MTTANKVMFPNNKNQAPMSVAPVASRVPNMSMPNMSMFKPTATPNTNMSMPNMSMLRPQSVPPARPTPAPTRTFNPSAQTQPINPNVISQVFGDITRQGNQKFYDPSYTSTARPEIARFTDNLVRGNNRADLYASTNIVRDLDRERAVNTNPDFQRRLQAKARELGIPIDINNPDYADLSNFMTREETYNPQRPQAPQAPQAPALQPQAPAMSPIEAMAQRLYTADDGSKRVIEDFQQGIATPAQGTTVPGVNAPNAPFINPRTGQTMLDSNGNVITNAQAMQSGMFGAGNLGVLSSQNPYGLQGTDTAYINTGFRQLGTMNEGDLTQMSLADKQKNLGQAEYAYNAAMERARRDLERNVMNAARNASRQVGANTADIMSTGGSLLMNNIFSSPITGPTTPESMAQGSPMSMLDVARNAARADLVSDVEQARQTYALTAAENARLRAEMEQRARQTAGQETATARERSVQNYMDALTRNNQAEVNSQNTATSRLNALANLQQINNQILNSKDDNTRQFLAMFGNQISGAESPEDLQALSNILVNRAGLTPQEANAFIRNTAASKKLAMQMQIAEMNNRTREEIARMNNDRAFQLAMLRAASGGGRSSGAASNEPKLTFLNLGEGQYQPVNPYTGQPVGQPIGASQASILEKAGIIPGDDLDTATAKLMIANPKLKKDEARDIARGLSTSWWFDITKKIDPQKLGTAMAGSKSNNLDNNLDKVLTEMGLFNYGAKPR
jgi:hypothetical protein